MYQEKLDFNFCQSQCYVFFYSKPILQFEIDFCNFFNCRVLLSIKNVHDAEGEIQKWMWVIFKVPLAIRFYFTSDQSIQGKNIA